MRKRKQTKFKRKRRPRKKQPQKTEQHLTTLPISDDNEDHIWEHKYTKDGLRESDASFKIFQMILHNPTMTYKEICKQENIPENTLYGWAYKYKYAERKLAKAQYETKILDNLELESKVIIVKKNILRNMIDEDLLDAYAEFNKKLIKWLDVDTIDTEVLKKQQTVNKHLNEYLDLRNKHLRNTLDTEELIKTLAQRSDNVEDKELRGLAGALMRSYEKIEGSLKK